MPDLIAIAYEDETTAGQAAAELERRADDLQIDPDAAGVIVCERDGSCQLTTSRHPGAMTGWSRFWGVLLGAVMSEFEASGIDPAFRRRIDVLLKPGTSILFVVVARIGAERATGALSQYGGTTVSQSLAGADTTELREALESRHVSI